MTTTADPTTWGWTAAGFAQPTLTNWLDYLVARAELRLGITLERSGSDPLYQVLAAAADGLDTATQLLAEGWSALDPINATGEALDALARSRDLERLPGAPSTVLLTLTGTPSVVVPAGTRFADPSGVDVFALDSSTTLGAAPVNASATCVADGPVAPATITTIVNPVAGLTAVAIASGEEVSPGRTRETDAELRVRLVLSRFGRGRTTDDAIRAALLAVVGVEAVTVTSNRTDVTDGDGRPPHSFEAVVYPDSIADALVGAVLLAQAPAGIATYGAESWSTTDESGATVTLSWNWASEVDVDVQVTGVTRTADAPADWQAQIQAAVVAYVAGLSIGDDVLLFRAVAAVSALPWVTGATVQMRRGANPFAAASVAIGVRELAVCATSDVSVSA